MSIQTIFPIGFALSLLAVTAAEARGPSARSWVIYPARAIESCRAGTAPDHFAGRCGELLSAYSRELQSCAPAQEGAAGTGDTQSAFQACAEFAARNAAGQVK